MKEVGRLMAEAHISYSKDFEGSCAEADLMVDLANELPGLIGARLTGGGFGGCTINLVEQDKAKAFAEELGKRYAAKTGIKPKFTSATPPTALIASRNIASSSIIPG
jgi:galactokinase